jgi:hypothetical protein
MTCKDSIKEDFKELGFGDWRWVKLSWGSCPMAGFHISDFKLSGYITGELVSKFNSISVHPYIILWQNE